jgi:hypothetical protein
MEVSTNLFDQFLLCQLSLADTAIADRIHKREQLVQRWVAESRRRNASVQRLQADAPLRPFWMRPYGRKIRAGGKMTAQRLRGVRGHDTSRYFSSSSRKSIFQAVNQELLHCGE